MAKIDTSTIEGYADMSAEDKLAALEGYEFEDHAEDAKRYKDAVSKASSEAAEYKRQLNEAKAKSTETQTEQDKQIAEMQAQLKQLQHDKTVSEYSARLVGVGYSPELAAASAASLADGDTDKVFENLSKFLEEHDKKLRAELAQKSIEPAKGNSAPDEAMTKKKLMAMTALERNDYSAKYPDEYMSLMRGK